MKLYYMNFGCKVNSYELEAIRQRAKSLGHSEAANISDADAVIINSCAVTSQAGRKCKNAAKSARLNNPGCCIALIGCFSQAFKDKVSELSYIDIILGSKNKLSVFDLIDKFTKSKQRQISVEDFGLSDRFEKMSIEKSGSKTRAELKIEDGCDMYCSYCIIPYARGHIRSKKIEDIRTEAKALASSGHKEIVLTGINLCCYGKDLKSLTLSDAVRAVNDTDGIERIRLSSLEPELITDTEIDNLKSCEKLCGHFHLSLQSGCDKTLMAMNRRYTSAQYVTIVNKLRESFENAAITTDVMVGFPGETDEDFIKSLEFVNKIGFAAVHVFPYSKREGTVASKSIGQVSAQVKKKRAQIMRDTAQCLHKKFLKTQLGTLQKVIFERECEPEYHFGHTDNYTKVKVLRKKPENKLHKKSFYVRIVDIKEDYCLGEIEDKAFASLTEEM